MMDRTLKERIIGAAVLVIFVVLVVPVFLDGPPEDGDTVSERILLPGQEDQNTKTVVLDRERTEPIPAASRPSSSGTPDDDVAPEQVEERPAPNPVVELPSARAETQPAPQPETPVVKQPASTTGMWAVQLGSFSNKQNAEKLAADLRKQGYAAFLSQLQTDAGSLHRVRIGPQKDRKSAEEMAARLSKVGHEGQVLPHP